MDSPLHEVALLVGLVLTVVAVSGLARSLRFPAPLLLVAVGVAGSFLPVADDLRPRPELLLVVLLPPLLYAAALKSSAIDIRHEIGPIVSLSVGLVLVTTVAVGLALHAAVPDIPLAAAMALGAIVAPPDAVAAVAVTRRAGLPRRAVTVLEGESLFNDATALVALRVSVAAVAGSVTALEAAGEFVGAAAGGAAIGLAVGLAVSVVRRRVTDSIGDTAISLTAPFLAFVPAEEVHASGILAAVVTGLVLAHRSPVDQDPGARLVEGATWSTLAFVLEGTVFVLIGLGLRDVAEAVDATAAELVTASLVVLAVVVLVRPLWIFGTAWLGTAATGGRIRPRPWPHLAAASWAGMRGVVSLAAALSLPLDFPQRELLIAVAVVVIVGTLGVQGLTLPAVIRRLGIRPPDPRDDALQRAHALEQASQAALARLDEMVAASPMPDPVVDALRQVANERALSTWERLGDQHNGEPPTVAYRRVRREMMRAEREILLSLRNEGEVDDTVVRSLQHELDLEEALLTQFEDADIAADEELREVVVGRPRVCRHMDEAPTPPPPDELACPDCVELGWEWVHLRQCLACGRVGCCDSSRGRHAEAHWQAEDHPVMRSVERGEAWRWCYVDRVLG
jgi:CPA1 family monovalent cation:H+ antiporter